MGQGLSRSFLSLDAFPGDAGDPQGAQGRCWRMEPNKNLKWNWWNQSSNGIDKESVLTGSGGAVPGT